MSASRHRQLAAALVVIGALAGGCSSSSEQARRTATPSDSTSPALPSTDAPSTTRSDAAAEPLATTTTPSTALPLYVPPSTTAPPDDGSPTTPLVAISDDPRPVLPATVDSADGRTVTVDDVSRILPLWGNIAEVVYSLGLGDRLVGRDTAATFDEVDDLPVVTKGHDVSAESVLSLRPTVVFAQTDTGPPEALEHIRNAGVPVVVIESPGNVDEVADRIMAIATALGVEAEGRALAERTMSEIDDARTAIPAGLAPPRVAFLYMRGSAGVYLIAGPGSGADSMIAAAGGIDAGTAMGLERAFTPLTSEALVNAAPDVILMTTTGLASVGGIDQLVGIPGIAQTPAGRDRRIVTVEDGLLYSFGARTPEALRELVGKLYAWPA